VRETPDHIGQFSFHDMVAAISGFISLFSKADGHAYFNFWDAILNKREPLPAARGATKTNRCRWSVAP
jgi:hypothetical protein